MTKVPPLHYFSCSRLTTMTTFTGLMAGHRIETPGTWHFSFFAQAFGSGYVRIYAEEALCLMGTNYYEFYVSRPQKRTSHISQYFAMATTFEIKAP